jgi:chromosomal replication initiator protein
MQPGCVALMSPQSALDETVQHVFAGLIGQKQYDHWFRDRTELALGDGELVVRAASPFLLKWLQKQFKEPLSRAAEHILGPAARVRYDSAVASGGAATGGAVSAPQPGLPPQDQPGLPAPEGDVLPSAAKGESTAITRVAPNIPTVQTSAVRPAGRRFADLAEFVPGPCNELALTAVRQICTRPDLARGPLVLYGPVGTGKTHLLEGIHRQLRRTQGDLQAVFLTAEQFTNYFTQAYRDHTLPAFRQRFRTVDVLLVDDVDFLDGKRVVQEEFLHTFKQLESFGKLVVLCSDRHPRLLAKTSDELRTRFLSGMVCRLEAPDLETRERIVSRKAALLDAEFTPETLKYVAERFSGNVRELEGALQCLQVYYRMTGKRVGITAARQTLSDLERDCLRVVRLADIERVVCNLFGVDADDLRSSSRTRSVCEPRMLAMYLARRHTRSAYSEIGRHFGGRNHATVIAAERKVTGWLQQGTSVRVASRTWQLGDILETLEQQLQAG